MAASDLLRTLFRYQAWANDELLEKVEGLDPLRHGEERYTAIRLLNHGYVVAQIFAAHLTGAVHGFCADNTEETPEQLSERLPFVFTDGDKGGMSRAEMLLHVITHGGYHRGEVGRILAQLSISPPWDTLAVHLHRAEPSRRLGQ